VRRQQERRAVPHTKQGIEVHHLLPAIDREHPQRTTFFEVEVLACSAELMMGAVSDVDRRSVTSLDRPTSPGRGSRHGCHR
jgi:hypothetical protein